MTDATPTNIGLTAWSALNPFGEPTAFLLVHPVAGADDGTLADAVARLGMKRLDAEGDILPIGTDTLYASLRAMSVELCTADGVWLSRPVTDDWTGNAIGRRYIVLVIGVTPLAEDAGSEQISAYLGQLENVFTALVKIRVRIEQS